MDWHRKTKDVPERCGSRLIVQRAIQDRLVRKLVKLAKAWKVGDPLDPATRVGSMIEKSHFDKVLGYIAAGQAEGARLVMGGKRIRADSGGYFVAVTLFDDVRNEMKIAREEIFGPVLSVISFAPEAGRRFASPMTRTTASRPHFTLATLTVRIA